MAELARVVAGALPASLAPDPAALGRAIEVRFGPSPDLDQVHAVDLWLAVRAAAGDEVAIRCIEDLGREAIAAALAPAAPHEADEVRQRLRTKLFVRDDRAPRIEAYLGRGPLRAWLRVCARREWLDYSKAKRGPVVAADEAVIDGVVVGPEPDAAADDGELGFLRAHYRAEFVAAAGEAFDGLTPRERNMLRQHYVHGLALGQVARLNAVHRATIHRWLADVRTRLHTAIRAALCDRFGVGEGELASIVRVVQSRLDLPLAPLLTTREPG